ncbi:hypothetical protein BARVI_00300 [Barnesiella viscericola DSM 18177]|uniref:Uncharacterized protein n=1 Tax=Barnesiella viscericola DSM 18177 TaxID=880074 RepID=W0EVD8_9BACT|nr:hypothetical protein BARVI_00300 [Barnesiella viscericola DSM 18177]
MVERDVVNAFVANLLYNVVKSKRLFLKMDNLQINYQNVCIFESCYLFLQAN